MISETLRDFGFWAFFLLPPSLIIHHGRLCAVDASLYVLDLITSFLVLLLIVGGVLFLASSLVAEQGTVALLTIGCVIGAVASLFFKANDERKRGVLLALGATGGMPLGFFFGNSYALTLYPVLEFFSLIAILLVFLFRDQRVSAPRKVSG